MKSTTFIQEIISKELAFMRAIIKKIINMLRSQMGVMDENENYNRLEENYDHATGTGFSYDIMEKLSDGTELDNDERDCTLAYLEYLDVLEERNDANVQIDKLTTKAFGLMVVGVTVGGIIGKLAYDYAKTTDGVPTWITKNLKPEYSRKDAFKHSYFVLTYAMLSLLAGLLFGKHIRYGK